MRASFSQTGLRRVLRDCFLGRACTHPLIRGVDTYPERVPEEKRSRSQTRARILAAAFALFVQQGFQGTTLSEVERRVGLKVGTGSLYHHFRTKDELLRAAIEAEVARCMAEVENERASITWPEDPRDQMVLAAKLTLSNIRRFEQVFRFLQVEGDRIPDLREKVTAALYGSGALGDWVHDPTRLVTIAALAGYHLFQQVDDSSLRSVSEEEFIEILVAMIPPGRPPGVDDQSYKALRAMRVDR